MDMDVPLLEPLESLLMRGSLLYNLDSPGEYGSDLLLALPFPSSLDRGSERNLINDGHGRTPA